MVYNSIEKTRILFRSVMAMVQDKKIHETYNVNKNYFHALHEVDKSNTISSFQGI